MKINFNVSDKITPLIGTAGTVATFSLGQLNDLVGIVVGLLTAAYLIRKHVRFSKERKP